MKKYNVDTAGDIMCNLTSMAMALDYLGIPNPNPEMQFEDYLEEVRIAKFPDMHRKNPTTWDELAKEFNIKSKTLELNTTDKNVIKSTLLPELEKGAGVVLSMFSRSSGKGHIVRLQDINDKGLIVDDPYGDVSQKIREREAGASGYRLHGGYDNRNKKVAEEGVGEDNLWTWAAISQSVVKYAVTFYKEENNK